MLCSAKTLFRSPLRVGSRRILLGQLFASSTLYTRKCGLESTLLARQSRTLSGFSFATDEDYGEEGYPYDDDGYYDDEGEYEDYEREDEEDSEEQEEEYEEEEEEEEEQSEEDSELEDDDDFDDEDFFNDEDVDPEAVGRQPDKEADIQEAHYGELIDNYMRTQMKIPWRVSKSVMMNKQRLEPDSAFCWVDQPVVLLKMYRSGKVEDKDEEDDSFFGRKRSTGSREDPMQQTRIAIGEELEQLEEEDEKEEVEAESEEEAEEELTATSGEPRSYEDFEFVNEEASEEDLEEDGKGKEEDEAEVYERERPFRMRRSPSYVSGDLYDDVDEMMLREDEEAADLAEDEEDNDAYRGGSLAGGRHQYEDEEDDSDDNGDYLDRRREEVDDDLEEDESSDEEDEALQDMEFLHSSEDSDDEASFNDTSPTTESHPLSEIFPSIIPPLPEAAARSQTSFAPSTTEEATQGTPISTTSMAADASSEAIEVAEGRSEVETVEAAELQVQPSETDAVELLSPQEQHFTNLLQQADSMLDENNMFEGADGEKIEFFPLGTRNEDMEATGEAREDQFAAVLYSIQHDAETEALAEMEEMSQKLEEEESNDEAVEESTDEDMSEASIELERWLQEETRSWEVEARFPEQEIVMNTPPPGLVPGVATAGNSAPSSSPSPYPAQATPDLDYYLELDFLKWQARFIVYDKDEKKIVRDVQSALDIDFMTKCRQYAWPVSHKPDFDIPPPAMLESDPDKVPLPVARLQKGLLRIQELENTMELYEPNYRVNMFHQWRADKLKQLIKHADSLSAMIIQLQQMKARQTYNNEQLAEKIAALKKQRESVIASMKETEHKASVTEDIDSKIELTNKMDALDTQKKELASDIVFFDKVSAMAPPSSSSSSLASIEQIEKCEAMMKEMERDAHSRIVILQIATYENCHQWSDKWDPEKEQQLLDKYSKKPAEAVSPEDIPGEQNPLEQPDNWPDVDMTSAETQDNIGEEALEKLGLDKGSWSEALLRTARYQYFDNGTHFAKSMDYVNPTPEPFSPDEGSVLKRPIATRNMLQEVKEGLDDGPDGQGEDDGLEELLHQEQLEQQEQDEEYVRDPKEAANYAIEELHNEERDRRRDQQRRIRAKLGLPVKYKKTDEEDGFGLSSSTRKKRKWSEQPLKPGHLAPHEVPFYERKDYRPRIKWDIEDSDYIYRQSQYTLDYTDVLAWKRKHPKSGIGSKSRTTD